MRSIECLRERIKSDIAFNVESPLPCDVHLARIAVGTKLHFILPILSHLGVAKDFLKVSIRNKYRRRAIVKQEAEE